MDWEEYWRKKRSRAIYDLIASFYRNFIIKGSLNFFIKKYGKRDDLLLHAGCGSGEVDRDIVDQYKIIAVDISREALRINKRDRIKIRGDIFSLPFRDETFNLIYNLGVMEHFKKEDIIKILCEFKRVLKKEGYIIIFWPPEYGVSVIFFKMLKGMLRFILRKEITFHPDEPSRLKSKIEAVEFLRASGLKLKEYYFGIKDFFTYSVIVAQHEYER